VALASVAWPAGQAAAAVPEADRAPASPITADKRGYVAGKYGIELDGINAGWVNSAEGGHATADVVTEKVGPDHYSLKHIANLKYEDLSVAVGAGMSKAFYSWISASWRANYMRKNGALQTADFQNNLIKKLEFSNALITETGMPALDGSSKDAALIDVTFTPETTRLDRKVSGQLAISALKQKQWQVSNFKLTIDGLDCTRVNKIEALVVKQKLTESPTGENRDYRREPAALEFPNLVVTLSESSAATWYDWFEDFVIHGNSGQAQEKNGKLEYLSANLQEVLFTVEFKHLGIFKLEPDNGSQASDNLVRLRAEMYVEQMTFTQGPVVTPNDTA
jgi:tail tube protein gp19